jgi:hypothetical protein
LNHAKEGIIAKKVSKLFDVNIERGWRCLDALPTNIHRLFLTGLVKVFRKDSSIAKENKVTVSPGAWSTKSKRDNDACIPFTVLYRIED